MRMIGRENFQVWMYLIWPQHLQPVNVSRYLKYKCDVDDEIA